MGEIILDAAGRDRYLAFTSWDARAAFALRSLCPPRYRLAMRRLNRELTAVAEQARLPRSSLPRP
ncbi:MAG: hypothetical protein BroJett022_22510 [Actinomycetes bacterium]|nr:MAG: hypothetical protein BroJett022_22510 [Actinomycetes bacterium]